MEDREVDRLLAAEHTFHSGLFASWKLSAVLLVIFGLGMIGPLGSSHPLVAVYFPGAFLAMALWSMISNLRKWGGGARPVLAILPISLYLIAATATLFIAYRATGETGYRRGAMYSLFMTIPFGLGGILLTLFYDRSPLVRARRAANSVEEQDLDQRDHPDEDDHGA